MANTNRDLLPAYNRQRVREILLPQLRDIIGYDTRLRVGCHVMTAPSGAFIYGTLSYWPTRASWPAAPAGAQVGTEDIEDDAMADDFLKLLHPGALLVHWNSTSLAAMLGYYKHLESAQAVAASLQESLDLAGVFKALAPANDTATLDETAARCAPDGCAWPPRSKQDLRDRLSKHGLAPWALEIVSESLSDESWRRFREDPASWAAQWQQTGAPHWECLLEGEGQHHVQRLRSLDLWLQQTLV